MNSKNQPPVGRSNSQLVIKSQAAADRLRLKCKAGPDSCGEILAALLGEDTPPLTDRQRDQTVKAAVVHFSRRLWGLSIMCSGCPQSLATAAAQAPELLDLVESRERQTGGMVATIARGVVAMRRRGNPEPAPKPLCAGCGVEMHPFAATVTPLHLENGSILCFICVGNPRHNPEIKGSTDEEA